MKAVIQRVTAAKVTVGEELISSIGRGICVLVGICQDDTTRDVEYMARKIVNTRIFDDDAGKRWSRSVMDGNMEVLCISQFTLYHTLKGNKPDFHLAMRGDQAETLYNSLLKQMANLYQADKVKDGKFGASMQVHIENDGPVTLDIETPPNCSTATPTRRSSRAKQ